MAAGIATLAIHGALAALLIVGLASGDAPSPPGDDALVTVVLSKPPPPPPPPERVASSVPKRPAAEGAKGDPLPREAPPAAIPLTVTPAAPVAGNATDPASGAGSQGTGTGAGGAGSGGGGGNDGIASPARRIAGALRDSDYPREAEADGLAGTVGISFRVRTNGRVDRCTVVRSSGYALLDELTCRLFTDRYRFRPATDASGAALDSTLQTSFTWGTRRRR